MNYIINKIMPEVTHIRDMDTNIYVVEGQTSALVIDTGYGFQNLREQVKQITDKPVTAIFTHGHIDHAFGGHHFEKVYMSEIELPVYEKHTAIKAQVKEHHAPGDVGITKEELEKWLEAKPRNITYTRAGDKFDLGGNVLEVISLKGHTPGSIGLLDRKHRILFSGDGVNNYIWMQLPESSSLEEYYETLKSLDPLQKDFDFICNGHSEVTLPVSFAEDMKAAVKALLDGAVGETFEHPVASGKIYNHKSGCTIIYDPDKVHNK